MTYPSRDDLSGVLRDVATARGLPNAHYTDPAIFDEEKRVVLFDTWAGLGFAKDVPEPGDANPVTFMGLPLVMVRDRQGRVRVFQNTCRHRGMILVAAKGKLRGMIRCPYHSWTYSLEGKLVATPHVGGPGHNTHAAVDRDTLGLVEVRAHVWRDVVFVNISGAAPEFADHAAGLLERWREFEQPLYHSGADSGFTLELETNWKLAVENYCESYHLPWIHPGLNSYSRLEDHYNIEAPGAYSGQGTSVYRQLRGTDGATFPDFDGLSAQWDTGAEYIALYPNVLFGVHRDHAFAILLEPRDHAHMVEHVEIYYPTPDTDADLRTANTAQWRVVFEEDIGVVEGMQKGRSSPGFGGGRFSPVMDGPTHNFHAWVAARLEAARRRLAAE